MFRNLEQLWKAPELQMPYNSSFSNLNYLSTPPRQQPSIISFQKCDVFSYAVIVQEMLYRKGVYYLTDEDIQKFKLFSKEDITIRNNYYSGFNYFEIY